MKLITVILVEKIETTIALCSVCNDGIIDILFKETWNSSSYLTDEKGFRLIEEMSRRIRACWRENKFNSNCVIVSLPGTLKNEVTILSSSRLGIREPVDISNILNIKLKTKCYIFHDTECLVTGELKYQELSPFPSSLVYLLVDEGIGSKIILNGKQYLGNGTAGTIGRLIVQPEGAYSPSLRSTGALEEYSSRPGVSKRLMEAYHAEIKKKDLSLPKEIEFSKFRQALAAASKSDWSQITYSRMCSGITSNDPIAIQVIERAAKYLGFAINSVITLINPELIILAGDMFSRLPGFSEKVLNYIRQYSWPLAWNNTNIVVSQHGRDIQIYGAIELYLIHSKK